MEFNRQEYNSVILAALLHDIGKVVQGSKIYKEREAHRKIGRDLINGFFNNKKIDTREINIELVCDLIEYHHDDAIENNKTILGKSLPIAKIVSNADSYSSSERGNKKNELKGAEPRLKTLLVSIFSEIKQKNKYWYYKIGKLHNHYSNLLPIIEEDTSGLIEDYEYVLKEFSNNLEKVKYNNFYNYLYFIQGLLEEYFWSVPSVTINEVNDISLYDHSMTSAAFAAALYKYHFENNTIDDIQSIDNKEIKKFLIISGDITGIQNFIFNINSMNPRGLSKELRGRSFFISLLGNLISLKILKELDLPYTNKIIDAGGKFMIIAPNTEQTIKKLDKIYDEIMMEIINKLYCSVIPVLSFSLSFSANDLKYENIPRLINNIQLELAKEKNRKFSKNDFYFNNYKLKNIYEKHIENGLCEMCKLYPKEKESDFCLLCNIGIETGKELTKEQNIFINYMDGNKLFGLDFSFDEQIKNEAILTEQIRDFDYIKAKTKDVANFIPVDDELIDIKNEDDKSLREDSLCFYCKDLECKKSIEKRKIFYQNILSFQCLSAHTPNKNKGSAVDHLAIIKGDIDNLGYLFSNGLEKNLTFSRYVNFSRMMNLFFTFYLKEFLKEKYPFIYTIYAGGDDFLFLGPWEHIINALFDIEQEFERYVCNNTEIHFSTAVTLFRPREPILEIVGKTEENLEYCKSSDIDKNNLSLFGEIIKLKDESIKNIRSIFNNLNSFIDNNTLNTSNLYRLLNYNYFYRKFKETGDIYYLKYDYLMTYDIKRNFSDKKCNENVDFKITRDYLSKLKEDENMEILRIPLSWVIYKNRKTKKNKKED
ncbi:MAG: type III-A CRISPR-associated protein Cas10/Csm1 [Candidatus Goldbacteria bacterium]|nr:type III-A CRISPR-associated protein Cas10/Csm1 [Candidatus Goldiibacteriota bacterium]